MVELTAITFWLLNPEYGRLKLMPRGSFGFTILELLISIAILALLSLSVIPNFHRFNQSQGLNNSARDLVSLLQSAQGNAQSTLNCPDGTNSLDWGIILNKNSASLNCQNPPNSTIPVSSCTNLVNPPAPLPSPMSVSGKTLNYNPSVSMDTSTQTSGCIVVFLNNQACFSSSCVISGSSLSIILKDSVSNQQNKIVINKGGAISSGN